MHKFLSMFLAFVFTAGGILSSVSVAQAAEYSSQANRSKWTWPTKSMSISRYYGSGTSARPGHPHYGIDIDGELGEDIYAARTGKVVKASCGKHEHKDLGCFVAIKHGKKKRFKTRYLHMNEVYVKKGDKVKKGDVIGTLGASGKVTGPVLHFEVRKRGKKKKSKYKPRNPLQYVTWENPWITSAQ